VPAIVTKGAPWSGLIEKQAGWHIDIGAAPLVKALEEALALSPAMLQAMGERGREWMRESFSWDRIGLMMRDTYKWLLQPDPASKPSCIHLS
jgi:glycosyltransferase involved in cell wall biosynthesis